MKAGNIMIILISIIINKTIWRYFMYRMSPSELQVRTYLALALLLAGLLVVRAKAAGSGNNGLNHGKQGSLAVTSPAVSNQSTRLLATDPAQFTLAAGQYQIVMFFAPWDRISQDAAQLMHGFEEKYRGQIRFSYLDVSDPKNRVTLQKLNDWFYPQFVFLDGQGHILNQWTTPSAQEMTMSIVNARLQTPPW
jgi:thiol-disulfide isomerase/thioredoxin